MLHQMRGEWFDTVSNCVTFSISAKKSKPEEVIKFRHTLVRLMSLCHGSALEEIAGNSVQVETIDTYGIDKATLSHLQECHDVHDFNKVEVMLHLVQSLIVASHDEGLLKVPPPILSRVFQTISRGFVNLLNAKKITDTRFPFPYAQLIAMLLSMHTVLTPCVITACVKSKVLAALISFVPTFGLCSLNFIASELENPFGTDDNDLPLHHFQEEMNSCLLMLLHTNTDMISGASARCITDFTELLKTVHITESGSNEATKRLSQFKEEGNAIGETDPPPNQPLLAPPPAAAPAIPQINVEERIAALQPRLKQNLEDFRNVLHGWTNLVEGQVCQLNQTMNALKVVNERKRLEGTGESTWEEAIPVQ